VVACQSRFQGVGWFVEQVLQEVAEMLLWVRKAVVVILETETGSLRRKSKSGQVRGLAGKKT
jgi:hypothetical protein